MITWSWILPLEFSKACKRNHAQKLDTQYLVWMNCITIHPYNVIE
jgi:hypothetical protein